MSLFKWLGASPPPLKKAKTTDEKRETQNLYEKTKRERSFQQEWKGMFQWLAYNSESNKMKCEVCSKHERSDPPGAFVTGSGNFKIDILKRHQLSESHMKHLGREKALQSKPGTSTAEQSLMIMNKAAASKIAMLMRNAHYVAKLGKPYTAFVSLCELDVAKGVDIGKTYISDKYCQKFIASIADQRRTEQKHFLDTARFISVISDGATDCSSKEVEIVFVRAAVHCEISTIFAGLKYVRKADAETITRGLATVLDGRFPDWNKKIVAMGTDGASVMVGRKGGVVKRMSDLTDRPFLKGIHCSAHRLELAYKDAIKSVPLHQKVELLLLNLYLFYKYSPLNRSNLKASFSSLGKTARVPTRMGGTRWLPHTKRALQNVLDGTDGLLLHLEQMQKDPKKESSCKAVGFLKLLRDEAVQYWLHFMMDVVKCLSKVSEAIQEKSSTVADIYNELEGAKLILNKYKTSAGPCLRKVSTSELEDKLSLRKVKLLDSLLEAISNRFSGDGKLFLGASTILTTSTWPDFNDESDFGDEHMVELVEVARPALVACCPSVDVDCVESDWTRMKSSIAARKSKVCNATWPDLETAYGKCYPNLFALVNYLLTLPGSSVDAERGFSCMKMVKSDWRSRLGEANLSDQMLIKLEVDGVGSFDPMPAVQHWLSTGERTRRPFYKDELRKCSIPHQKVISHVGPLEALGFVDVVDGVTDNNQVGDLEEEEEGEEDEHVGEEVHQTETDEDESESDSDDLCRKDLIELQRKAYRLMLA